VSLPVTRGFWVAALVLGWAPSLRAQEPAPLPSPDAPAPDGPPAEVPAPDPEAPPRDVVPAPETDPDAVVVGTPDMGTMIDPPRARSGNPLTLGKVIGSMRGVHPKLEEAESKVEAAEGKLLSKEGGFDPKAKLSFKGQPLGYYDKGNFDALITQDSPLWGTSFYAGYRRSVGAFPTYDGQYITLNGGEFRAGFDLPVWRGGPIDQRRADIAQAEIGVSGAERDRDMTTLLLDNAAAYAYWTWVEAGLVLEINEDLLDVAEKRNRGLTRLIEEGAAPEIEGVDNLRTVLDRRTKVIAARRKLENAAIKLSLYLRDAEGRTRRPGRELLPEFLPEPDAPDAARLDDDIRHATKTRADVRALQAAEEQAQVEAELRDNQVAPQVNIMGWVSQDIGSMSLQDKPHTETPQLRPFDLGIGVSLDIPLLLRKDRGNAAAARGKLGAARAKVRWQRDQAEADVRQAYANLRAAYQTVSLARDTRRAADTLARAERRKFALGSSDILYVNIRELYAAEAATKEVKAKADYQRALADYLTAAGRGLR